MTKILNPIASFVKEKRKKLNLTQIDLAEKAGVGIRFVRELEQGKETLQLNKVNQVLQLFGHEAEPVKKSFKD
ncbi:MAG: helix-turn-helix transcriptional regulator [Ignavibacteriota bacterium]|jgi:y4mF family transcriptional regulator|nr:MAG: transcriptional regulator [Chlorobiota bacterium]MBE7475616.1 helix-turn-helix transcriptional regulator [Ignavibacteriales bacterium]MBL1123074.1 transcriptional regulator [Ignavibacteriota bacterium]MCE7855713.1 transcriptional regulator [Ignavibacteria bacterium CHB3]MCZ7615469.1 helix-turn-helix transcriptional regulator [Ignavibacteriaceae bacterium]MEB2297887.1 helix-turn-helix transcriptional regulator [Ignavibacteria bacterium]